MKGFTQHIPGQQRERNWGVQLPNSRLNENVLQSAGPGHCSRLRSCTPRGRTEEAVRWYFLSENSVHFVAGELVKPALSRSLLSQKQRSITERIASSILIQALVWICGRHGTFMFARFHFLSCLVVVVSLTTICLVPSRSWFPFPIQLRPFCLESNPSY